MTVEKFQTAKDRHCEKRSNEAIQTVTAAKFWIAPRSLSSGGALPDGQGVVFFEMGLDR
jgi:hypothetical protein